MHPKSWRFAATIVCLSAAYPRLAAAETLVGPYPFAVGDKFVFAYTSKDSVRTGTGAPVVTTVSYTETTTILAAVAYEYPPAGGKVTAYPVQTTAAWTDSAGSHTLKTIEYRNFVVDGATTNDLNYGYSDVATTAEPNDITLHEETVRVFGSPFILDELPETKGSSWGEPIAWTETTDNYYATSSGDSNVLDSKYASSADGSYTDSGMNTDVQFDIVQKANGTGTKTIGPSTAQEEWSFALPETSSKGEIIPVTVTFEGKRGVNDVPDWFPGGGAAPQPLATQAGADKGLVAVPAGCGKYAGKRAQLLQATYSQVAPVAGYTLDETNAWYVIPKIGRVCLTDTYTRVTYDSEVSGKVVSTEVFASSAGLISEVVK